MLLILTATILMLKAAEGNEAEIVTEMQAVHKVAPKTKCLLLRQLI